MNSRDFQDITFGKDEKTGIVMLTLNRPEIKNALIGLKSAEIRSQKPFSVLPVLSACPANLQARQFISSVIFAP